MCFFVFESEVAFEIEEHTGIDIQIDFLINLFNEPENVLICFVTGKKDE